MRLVKVWVKFASWGKDLQLAAHFFIKRYEANALMFDILKGTLPCRGCVVDVLSYALTVHYTLMINQRGECRTGAAWVTTWGSCSSLSSTRSGVAPYTR